MRSTTIDTERLAFGRVLLGDDSHAQLGRLILGDAYTAAWQLSETAGKGDAQTIVCSRDIVDHMQNVEDIYDLTLV